MPLSCKHAHVRHGRLGQASAKHAQQRGGSHTGELRPRPDQSRRGSCGRVSVTGGDAEGMHSVMHSGNSRAHFQLLWIAVERRVLWPSQRFCCRMQQGIESTTNQAAWQESCPRPSVSRQSSAACAPAYHASAPGLVRSHHFLAEQRLKPHLHP